MSGELPSEILNSLGFRTAGRFFLVDGSLDFELRDFSSENGTYVFMVKDRSRYVGETTNGIRHRMRQYRKPGPRQKTNQYVKGKMLEELKKGNPIQIWFLPESKIANLKMEVRNEDLHFETTADPKLLERFLINMLQADWNRG